MAEDHNVTKILTSDDGYCWAEVANRDSKGHIIIDTYRTISDSYSKDEINTKLSSALVYKGTVSTYADLAAITDMKTGDVWNVTAAYGTTPAGTNWAWNGTAWDPLGGTVDLSAYLSKSDASSTYLSKTDASSTYVPVSRTINGHSLFGDIFITKSDIGLSQVDNTADKDKPVSTATQTALNAKVNNTGDTMTGTLTLPLMHWYSGGTPTVNNVHDFSLGNSATDGDPFLSFTNSSGTISAYVQQTVTLDYSKFSYEKSNLPGNTGSYSCSATPENIIIAANREFQSSEGLSVQSATSGHESETITYSLNKASSTQLGGIKIGSGIDIDSGGVASAQFKKGEILTISW